MKKLESPQVGSLGDVVASTNHYGQHLHKKGQPKKRRTKARLDSDQAMRVVAEAWNNLTDEQYQRWAIAAPNVPSRKVLGKAGRLDPRGLFAKINLPRARLGQRVLIEPPPKPDFDSCPFLAFTIKTDDEGMWIELWLARVPAEDILLRASPPCNAGRRRNWDYRVLGLLKAPAKGPNNITRLYVDKFDLPPVGKRIFLQAQQQVDGWRGQPWQASAVVPQWKSRTPRKRRSPSRGPHAVA
jgi:hypothetical protein